MAAAGGGGGGRRTPAACLHEIQDRVRRQRTPPGPPLCKSLQLSACYPRVRVVS
jgi:hypothetical protein